MSIKQNLSDSQKRAVAHLGGPMLVLAGPGSGKTFTITQRVRNLIELNHVNPSNILVITFTKASAIEMKMRFNNLTSKAYQAVTFGTFHAVFFMVLKYAYHYNASNIIREEDRIRLIRDLAYHMQLEYEEEKDFISSILGEISKIKNNRLDISSYYSANCGEEVFRRLYQGYEEALRKKRLIDFDDMLVYTCELFEKRKDILSAWQKKYRYILIDEFQDVNQLQFDIIKLLAKPEDNLFAVGDDDQSIYRFRGAKPEIMLHFKEDYPNAQVVVLEENYRSQANIVKCALCLIGHNQARYQKEIRAVKPQGSKVDIMVYETQRKENERLIELLRRHEKNGRPYREMAVLFRTNTQAGLLLEQLMEYNIPFTARDAVPNLYEHWITQDIFTYIRIAQGSRSRRDFLKIMNRPNRYISRDSLEEETVAFDVWENFYSHQPWVAERIGKLCYEINMLKDLPPFAAVNYIRRGIGYDDYIKDYAEYKNINKDELLETLEAVSESAKEYDTYQKWNLHITQYTQELKRQRRERKENEESVTLSTLHSAKGLEFEEVHIIDVNEGIMPYKKAVLPSEIEEERRLFYVGMTRAKKELYLYSVEKIKNHETEVSRFLTEAGVYSSSKSASSSSSSKRSSTASYSSSSSIFSRLGLPSSSSE